MGCGSHRMDHVRASLEILFPKLNAPGVYMLEDLHTAYWPDYGDGLDAKSNFFRVVGDIVDDMHRWYHGTPAKMRSTKGRVSEVHLHDSMVVLEKAENHRPTHSRVGKR